jgi:hypothetical protein
MDGLADKTYVFIPAKLLPYMTGIELGYRMGASSVVDAGGDGCSGGDETQREVVIESLKSECEIRMGSPPGL